MTLMALELGSMTGPADAQNKNVYVIDKGGTYQEIDNFSASAAWRCDFIGKSWPQ